MISDSIRRFFTRRKNYSRLLKRFDTSNGITLVMKGRDVGFFSIFFQVRGAIDFCYRNKVNLIVDFEKGPYFDERIGPNWWNYYFEKDSFMYGPMDSTQVLVDDTWSQKVFSYYGRALSPHSVFHYLKDMGVKEKYTTEVEDYLYKDNGLNICGVHYRGTDKVSGAGQEAIPVPYEFVIDILKSYGPEYRYFIATDEQQFLDYISDKWPERVLFRTAFRSKDQKPIHDGIDGYSMYRAGEEALLDCLILSQCSLLVRTDSNLSYACRFFNPAQKKVNVTKAYLKSVNR